MAEAFQRAAIVAARALALLALAPGVGAIDRGYAAEAPRRAAEPFGTTSVAVRRALRDFDRFLDHHPLLEDELRLNPRLATRPDYLEANPELREFLRASPDVAQGLALHPRYFLYRALLRQASAPLPYHDVIQFGDVLDQQPDAEKELVRNPSVIRDESFLRSHPLLRDFILQRPGLAKVFLPPPAVAKTN